jgi:toxin ParE1/3/4
VGRRIGWTKSAWHELETAADYIATDSPRYAAALVAEARAAARSLHQFPLRGRIVPEVSEDAVRELFVKSYRLIYEIREEKVIILAFIHGARRFPSNLV